MDKSKIYTNSKDDGYTPLSLIRYVEKVEGVKFDFDPATTKERAEYCGFKEFRTIEDGAPDYKNGPPGKNIGCNPPFSNKNQFLEQLRAYKRGNHNSRVFVLLPNSFSTNVFQEFLLNYAKINFLPKRVKFEPNDGSKPTTPAFDSSIIELTNQYCTEYRVYGDGTSE